MTQGEEQYIVRNMFPIMKKVNTSVLPNVWGKFWSTEFRSLLNLFNILPNGTLSKNSFNDENNRLNIILLCMNLDICTFENENIIALIKAKNPYKKPKKK